jgi:hypothetical protein
MLLHAKAHKKLPRKVAIKVFLDALRFIPNVFTYFWDSTQHKELAFIEGLGARSVSLTEAYQLYQAVRATEKIHGDVAEVGVYRGDSAKVITEATNKPLHLFDTFGAGLPAPSAKDDAQWHEGGFMLVTGEFDAIKHRLPDAHFYQGVFPATAQAVVHKKFSFVHLDVDIYQSTLDGLEFFYPRMSKGGVIISHDYHGADGVKTAFNEFFQEKSETVIALSTSQCLVVKL